MQPIPTIGKQFASIVAAALLPMVTAWALGLNIFFDHSEWVQFQALKHSVNGRNGPSSSLRMGRNGSSSSFKIPAVRTRASPCAPGATPSEIPVSEEANYDEVVQHPTGLTFRKHILLDKSQQPARIASGTWEKVDQPYMERVFKSDPKCTRSVFIDGGAAFGYYSILAAVTNPCLQVQAFNPHPRFAEVMKLNVDDNIKSGQLKSPNICINMAALSDTEGETYMNFGYGGRIGTKSGARVRMTTLDAFVEKNVPSDTQILLVKLDVEGQEANVMKGAAKLLQGCRVKFWNIGIHGKNLLQPVVDALISNGYKITSASADGYPNGGVTAEC